VLSYCRDDHHGDLDHHSSCTPKSSAALLEALHAANVLEDLEIIVGVDATASNADTGKLSFQGRNLHDVTPGLTPNPYYTVLRAAAKFLERDVCGEGIPLCYFGTRTANALGGCEQIKECRGVEDLCETYRSTIANQSLCGPTSFIPLIRKAVEQCIEEQQFHLLLIITDGAVTDPDEHLAALKEASVHPLSIVCVGVGDGPFDRMHMFDARAPKNFHFVNFQRCAAAAARKQSHASPEAKDNNGVRMNLLVVEKDALETEFFFQAFMEIPEQYQYFLTKLGYKPKGGHSIKSANPGKQLDDSYDPPAYTQ
jgi:hypothetical protein